ncbi:MAG: efflux RND transporter permease subunit [Planctomycetes bacterium]|nr:efflux RND transporter permease subunit [Planctomycetota bacterium]
MQGFIRSCLEHPRSVTVVLLVLVVIGLLCTTVVPVDILPVFNSPAVQVLTFYGGMPADNVAKDITNRMERWTGQSAGLRRQESRSILGASIVTNFYRDDVDPNGALTQVNSLASAAIPNLPPGTLPPVILPYDPTATVPACLVAVDSKTQGESILYDVGRYEVRNMIMNSPGAVAPVVYGGKLRAVLAYIDRIALEARKLSPLDVMKAMDNFNIFLPTGDVKLGSLDYALDSNSMYKQVDHMRDIPLRVGPDSAEFLGDVAVPRDSSLIQQNIVRVDGKREVYIPVFRQHGSSTLKVVEDLRGELPKMEDRLSRPGINLKMVMDQSIYVRQSLKSLIVEGLLGAGLCSLVILIFLGQWRMTVIAMFMIPFSVMAAVIGLYATGNTINVMTLAGLALSIGPLVDIAIVCLENTHRHLSSGIAPRQAAYNGAREVVMPELVATCSTLLVLAPLALMPGTGQFLFRPMAFAVTFAMIAAFLLGMSFVPVRCAAWLKHSKHDSAGDGIEMPRPGLLGRVAMAIQKGIDAGLKWYVGLLNRAMRHRIATVVAAVAVLLLVIITMGTRLRREFFPDVDAGAFEMYVRANTGTRIELTEKQVGDLEQLIRNTLHQDLELIVSELGVRADWSAAYTPNSGPMDAVIKVQLIPERQQSSQAYVEQMRQAISEDDRFAGLEVAFNSGGTIRSALNEGRVTPINISVHGKDLHQSRQIAEKIRKEVETVDGVVDVRILQRLDYPEYMMDVDRTVAAQLGLDQQEVIRNVVAAMNSSIQFNKKNFWIDPISHNQYYVGVQYPEKDIKSLKTLLDIPITGPLQRDPIPLSNVVSLKPVRVPAEISHYNLRSTIDINLSVHRRDLGHVAAEIESRLAAVGQPGGHGEWLPFDPATDDHTILPGSEIVMSGEYARMKETFRNFGLGLLLAMLLVYCLMVMLLDSYVIPLIVLSAVPVGLAGVIPALYFTETAINVQSLLGVIFMVGIVVANTVLLTDFAQRLRTSEDMSPTEAIVKAAEIRARPVIMTALAALFALVPMALALERGSEANAPLGRAVIGGLLAGLVTTLVVVPALYSLAVKDDRGVAKPEPLIDHA